MINPAEGEAGRSDGGAERGGWGGDRIIRRTGRRGRVGTREGRERITLHRAVSFLRSFDFPFFARAKEARRKTLRNEEIQDRNLIPLYLIFEND